MFNFHPAENRYRLNCRVSQHSLDGAELFENLNQWLFADVPRDAAQEHLRRVVDHFVDAWLQISAPSACGIEQSCSIATERQYMCGIFRTKPTKQTKQSRKEGRQRRCN